VSQELQYMYILQTETCIKKMYTQSSTIATGQTSAYV